MALHPPGKLCPFPLGGVGTVTRGSLVFSSFPSSNHGFNIQHGDRVTGFEIGGPAFCKSSCFLRGT